MQNVGAILTASFLLRQSQVKETGI